MKIFLCLFVVALMLGGFVVLDHKPECTNTKVSIMQEGVEFKIYACRKVGWLEVLTHG